MQPLTSCAENQHQCRRYENYAPRPIPFVPNGYSAKAEVN